MRMLKHFAIGLAGASLLLVVASTNVEAKTATVTVNSLNLREKATSSSRMVDGLIKGQVLEVLEELDGWYKVKADGKIGYVSADYVKLKEENSTTNNEKKEEKTDTENTNTENVNNDSTNTEKVAEGKENTELTNTQTTNNEVVDNKNTNVINENTKPNEVKQPEVIKEFEVKEATLIKDTKGYILPLLNSNVLKELKVGAKVTIFDEVNGWYYIADDEINAWVLKSAIENNISDYTEKEEKKADDKTETEKENENDNEKVIEKKTMYVNTTSINVRKGPGTNYEVVDALVLNNKVNVVAEVDDWYKVEYSDKVGYIAKRLLSENQKETTSRGADERNEVNIEENVNQEEEQVSNSSLTEGEEVVQFAKKYLGAPYVYGGSGPNSFDCSGFTMFVYKNFGVNLSHGATSQSRVGEYVSKDDLMPGDLVFFKDYQTLEGIAHVGIYIGDGNFIHASSGTGYCVKISTLLSGSYNTRYATARRIL